MFAINVRGTMAATQAALKHKKSGGRILMSGHSQKPKHLCIHTSKDAFS
jgi:hypothetical protein